MSVGTGADTDVDVERLSWQIELVCRPPKRSELRLVDLPERVWALVDEGAELLLGPENDEGVPMPVVREAESGSVLYPEGEGLGELARALEAASGQKEQSGSGSGEGSPRPLVWTERWPALPGWYWFFGHRPWDLMTGPPALSVARAEVQVVTDTAPPADDRTASAGPVRPRTRKVLVVTSEGKRLVEGMPFCRGLWAALAPPAPADLPVERLERLPPARANGGVPGSEVHCVRAGKVLCGAPAGPGQPLARTSQLGMITCPTCRAAAERM